jgi:hypothetical protein
VEKDKAHAGLALSQNLEVSYAGFAVEKVGFLELTSLM